MKTRTDFVGSVLFFITRVWYFTKPCLFFEIDCHTVFLEYDKFNLDFEKGFGEPDRKKHKRGKVTDGVKARGGRQNTPRGKIKKIL